MEQKKKKELKKKKKKKDSLRDLYVNIKSTNIYIVGTQEEEREKGQRTHLKK